MSEKHTPKMKTDKTLRSIITQWSNQGGWLYRYKDESRWHISEDLSEIADPIILAWFPDLSTDEIPEGIEYELARVTAISVRDVNDAPIDYSVDSAYLDLYGYRFRVSDHRAVARSSSTGVVRSRVVESAEVDNADSILREMAREWIREQNRGVNG